ncbi:MAG: hypothetical protein H6713_39230 [Myxococcales bacterium]|nr:hypothetical protein [Myxococcales bacterium]
MLTFACTPGTAETTESSASNSGSESTSDSGTSAGATSASTTSAATTNVSSTSDASVSTSASSDSATSASESDTASTTGAIEPGECDATLEGCNEGYKCNVFATEQNQNILGNLGCFPLDPDGKQIDEPCDAGDEPNDGIDDCVEGAVCWNVNEEGQGTCWSLCPLMGNDYECFYEGAGNCAVCQECAVGLCVPACNPLLDECAEGTICVPDSQSFGCVLDASDGQAPAGTPCEFVNVCNSGTVCIDPSLYPAPACEGQSGCCAPHCDWSEFDADLDGVADMGDPASACELPGTECVAWYEDPQQAPPEVAGVGVCVAMP